MPSPLEIAIRISCQNDASQVLDAVASSASRMASGITDASGRSRDALGRFTKSAQDTTGALGGATQGAAKLGSALQGAGGTGGGALGGLSQKASSLTSRMEQVSQTALTATRAFSGFRMVGSDLHRLGSEGLNLANSMMEVSREADGAEARLEGLFKQQQRLNDLPQVRAEVTRIATQGHAANERGLTEAAVQLGSDGVKTEHIPQLLEATARNALTVHKEVGRVGEAFAKAYGELSLTRLRRMNILFSDQEVASLEAAKGISRAAGETEFMRVVMASTERNAVALGEGLTEVQKAANDMARNLESAQKNMGAGAQYAKNQVDGLGYSILAAANASPELEKGAGYVLYMGSSALSAAGSVLQLTGSLAQTVLGVNAFRAARLASAAAADVEAASTTASALAADADAASHGAAALAATADADALGAAAIATTAAAAAADADVIALTAQTAALGISSAAADVAALSFRSLATAQVAAAGASAVSGGAAAGGGLAIGGLAVGTLAEATVGGVLGGLSAVTVGIGTVAGGAIYNGIRATGVLGKDAPGAMEAAGNAWARISNFATGQDSDLNVTQGNGYTETENKNRAKQAEAEKRLKEAEKARDEAMKNIAHPATLAILSGHASPSASSPLGVASVAAAGLSSASRSSSNDDQAGIEDLEDQLAHASKGEKPGIREQLRLARRGEKHEKTAERATKADERAAKAVQRERDRFAKKLQHEHEKALKQEQKFADKRATGDAQERAAELTEFYDTKIAELESQAQPGDEARTHYAKAMLEAEKTERVGTVLNDEAHELGSEKAGRIAQIHAQGMRARAGFDYEKDVRNEEEKAEKKGHRHGDAETMAWLRRGGSIFDLDKADKGEGASTSGSGPGVSRETKVRVQAQNRITERGGRRILEIIVPPVDLDSGGLLQDLGLLG